MTFVDRYTEQILNKKPSGGQKALFAGTMLIIAVGVYFILFIGFSVGVAIIAVGCFAAYMVKQGFDAEYEYLFVNGDCDIAKIVGKSSRKDIYSFKESDVKRVMTYNSDVCQNEFEINGELSIKNFTSGISDNAEDWYVFFTNVKSGTVAVILELNEKSIEHVNECYKKKLN